MTYEVELKFPTTDAEGFVSRITALGAQAAGEELQQDRYFDHPSRSFADTDEALRVRQVGERNRITYKGPLEDPIAKTRRELEIPFANGVEQAERLAEVFRRLGFREVRTVTKHRRLFQLAWQNRDLELTVDEVEGLGTFIEIETLSDRDDKDAARDAILELANQLQLRGNERRSYLQLLLASDARQS
jgi:adenylate cyclase class 2